jgi:hypothetical protein
VTDDRPEAGAGADSADAAAAAAPPAAPAEAPPLNAIALAKEVMLERMQNLLEWLLRRLKRYRAGRGNWWDK